MIKFNDEYYKEVIKKYNYNEMDFKPIDYSMKNISKKVLSEKWLCHHNGDVFVDSLKKNQKAIITTGIGLSGTPHMGTLSQIMRAIFLQKAGFNVQFVLGDLDSYNARNQSLDVLKERADHYRKFIKSLGFDVKKGILRTQSNHLEILKTAYLISNCLTDQDFLDAEEDLSELYKKEKIYNGIEFRVKQAILLMVADFIHLGMVDNYKNVMVMLGLEEHLYVAIARKVVDRMKLNVDISAMYSRIIKGLNGYPKMSKSIKGSAITVDMDKETILNLIMNSPDDYKNAEDSTVFQMMSAVSYYTSNEINVLRKLCELKNKEWVNAKKKYAYELYEICRKW